MSQRRGMLGFMSQPGQPPSGGLLGGSMSSPNLHGLLRQDLYPGEQSFFGANPNVAGMAAEDGRVVLNPSLSDPAAQKSVFLNEASRLYMRQNGTPEFQVTPEQRASFAGTPYGTAPEEALRGTILARALSGDPSAGNVTPDQMRLAQALMNNLFKWQPP